MMRSTSTSATGAELEPAQWMSSKLGQGMCIGGDGALLSRGSAEGCSTALCDAWLSKDITTVGLVIEEAGTDVFVGVVGRNYLHASWDEPLHSTRHGVLVEVSTGRLFYKGSRLDFPMLSPLKAGTRVNLVIDQQQQALTVQVLAPDDSVAMDVTLEAEKRIPAEVAVAVSMRAGAVRLVGAVTEKPELKLNGKVTKDLWDDDNVIKENFLGKQTKDNSQEQQRKAMEHFASVAGMPDSHNNFVRAPYTG